MYPFDSPCPPCCRSSQTYCKRERRKPYCRPTHVKCKSFRSTYLQRKARFRRAKTKLLEQTEMLVAAFSNFTYHIYCVFAFPLARPPCFRGVSDGVRLWTILPGKHGTQVFVRMLHLELHSRRSLNGHLSGFPFVSFRLLYYSCVGGSHPLKDHHLFAALTSFWLMCASLFFLRFVMSAAIGFSYRWTGVALTYALHGSVG